MPTAIKVKTGIVIRCKPCHQHIIAVPRWNFNGDYERPTISPSVNETCNSPDHPSYQPQAMSSRCHFSVADGQIQYHGDCSHALAGQTMPLEAWEQADIDRYNSPGYQE